MSNKDLIATQPAAVNLIRSICYLPVYHSTAVPVRVKNIRVSVLVEADKSLHNNCLQVDDSLVTVDQGFSTILVYNN